MTARASAPARPSVHGLPGPPPCRARLPCAQAVLEKGLAADLHTFSDHRRVGELVASVQLTTWMICGLPVSRGSISSMRAVTAASCAFAPGSADSESSPARVWRVTENFSSCRLRTRRSNARDLREVLHAPDVFRCVQHVLQDQATDSRGLRRPRRHVTGHDIRHV